EGHAADGCAAGDGSAHIDAVGTRADCRTWAGTQAEFAGIGLADSEDGSTEIGGRAGDDVAEGVFRGVGDGKDADELAGYCARAINQHLVAHDETVPGDGG